jgi:hypothetical protein
VTRYAAVLGPEELLPERPFTDPGNTVREAEMMQSILESERKLARKWGEEGESRAHVGRGNDAEGRRHLLVVPDTQALVGARDVTAVGFFSRPREDVDHAILFELEDELVARMGTYAEAGLLSYYDVELVKGAYGNLILFSTPDVPEAWYGDVVHRRAVELSPGHYYEVRLHKGFVPGRLVDEGKVVIERTKYFDFTGESRWLALRRFRGETPG